MEVTTEWLSLNTAKEGLKGLVEESESGYFGCGVWYID